MTTTVLPCLVDDWRSPIIGYLLGENVPSDPKERRRLQTRAARFYQHKGVLYKRSYLNLSSVVCPENRVKRCWTSFTRGRADLIPAGGPWSTKPSKTVTSG